MTINYNITETVHNVNDTSHESQDNDTKTFDVTTNKQTQHEASITKLIEENSQSKHKLASETNAKLTS